MEIRSSKQTRRIQLSGGSTYIVSLPKNWIDELKIRVGENITIVKNLNRSLTLFPEEQNDENDGTAVLYPSQKDSIDSVKRKIIAAYLAGYKTIKIKTRGMKISIEHSKSIRELVKVSMIGTEIVESSSEAISIQILTRLPELSFDTALKRMYRIVINMINESIESLEETDIVHADVVISMDDEVDRFGMYMRRNLMLAVENENVLHDIGLKKPSDCIEYRTIISKIERIGDHASAIAKRVKFIEDSIEQKTINKIKKLSSKTIEAFEESIVAVHDHDFQKGENIAEQISKIVKEQKEIVSKIQANEKNSTTIRFVLEDLRRIAEYSSDIAEVAIDENIHTVIFEEKINSNSLI